MRKRKERNEGNETVDKEGDKEERRDTGEGISVPANVDIERRSDGNSLELSCPMDNVAIQDGYGSSKLVEKCDD